MKRTRTISRATWLVLMLVIALPLLGVVAHADARAAFTVQLLGFNDFHGYTDPPGGTMAAADPAGGEPLRLPAGGAAYLAALVQQLRARNPNTTLVAAGDLIGASPLVSALFHDEAAIESLNRMGLAYSAVGNHEFDKGLAELQRIQRGGCHPQGRIGIDTCIIEGRYDGARFRYLAANVVDTRSGKTVFPSHAIQTYSDGRRRYRVAFVGLVLKGTPAIVAPAGIAGLAFLDEASAVNRLVPSLHKRGVDAIVVLVHQGGMTTGLYDDASCPGLSGDILPIVNALDPAVDLVISGHTHRAYTCSALARDGRTRIPLTSAGDYGRVLTRIELRFPPRGSRDHAHARATVTAHNLAVVNDRAPNPLPAVYPTLSADAAQSRLIATYDALAAPLTNRLVGRITADITRQPNEAGESALGDLIADAQLAQTAGEDSGRAVLALMNSGGIRADLIAAQISGDEQPGEITYGEAFNVQPFYNTLVTMTLTGSQLKTVLEQQWLDQASPRILQVSQGFRYRYDDRQPPGSKVIADSITLNGEPVRPDLRYRVTVNSYIADGGDRYPEFRNGQDRTGGALDLDALTAYFARHTPLSPAPQDRVQRLP